MKVYNSATGIPLDDTFAGFERLREQGNQHRHGAAPTGGRLHRSAAPRQVPQRRSRRRRRPQPPSCCRAPRVAQ